MLTTPARDNELEQLGMNVIRGDNLVARARSLLDARAQAAPS
jgi:hypothetical protein